MGNGTREHQFKKRFGLGKPIDTYGISCIHAKPISLGTKATTPKVPFDWALLFEDASVAMKISSESWARSFVKEIMDYGKLVQIGEGEKEIQGLKIDMEKGIIKAGYSDSIGKSYYDLTLVDTGSIIRVYEDNTVSVWHKGGFRRLKTEQLDAGRLNTEPLEIEGGTKPDGSAYPGTDLTTILMRDYLENGFFDKFVVGQETDKVFEVKGTVTANEESTHGRYVAIEFEANTVSGRRVKEVRITADGARVNGKLIVGVETREDGAIYLHYKDGDDVWGTPIKIPDTNVNQGKRVDVDYLTTGFDYNDIQGKTRASDLFEKLNIKSSTDYTERVAYAAFARNKKAFDAEYGERKCDALLKVADIFTESAAKEMLGNLGLDIEKVDVEQGVRPGGGKDIVITKKDGKTLILDVEYTKDDLPTAKWRMAQKFAKNKADLGMIFYKGEYYVYINSATEYETLANIAKDIARAGSRSLKDLAGIAAIGGLGILTGHFTDANNKSISVTDDAGRWIGQSQNSYIDHTAINRSTVFNRRLTLSSVDGSYLQNVRSAGSTIIGSAITDSNSDTMIISSSLLGENLLG